MPPVFCEESQLQDKHHDMNGRLAKLSGVRFAKIAVNAKAMTSGFRVRNRPLLTCRPPRFNRNSIAYRSARLKIICSPISGACRLDRARDEYIALSRYDLMIFIALNILKINVQRSVLIDEG